MAKTDPALVAKAMQAVTEQYDADVLVYVGFIAEPDDDRVLNICRKRKNKRKNVLLILSTPGGSADAAYRIARCLQRAYKTKSTNMEERGSLFLYIHDLCKSAGTLVALGASNLIMSQRAELGPIDVQLLNEEEVGERRSGLAPRQAMQMLSDQVGSAFFRMFRLMRTGGLHLPTKLAAENATKLAVGMIEPLYAQLDPIRMGEIERFVKIAEEYGERLASQNVLPDTIRRLLTAYPSHEFVIDREEASDLFDKVDIPSDHLELVAGTFISLNHPTPENMNSFVKFINGPAAVPVEEAGDASKVDNARGNDASAKTRPSTGTRRSGDPGGSRDTRARTETNGGGSVEPETSR